MELSELGFLILAELQSDPDKKEKFVIAINEGVTTYSPKRKEAKDRGRKNTWYYLSLVGEIGFSIAIPITMGVLVGSYLDDVTGAYPKWTLGLMLAGVVLAALHLYRVIRILLND